MKLLIDGKEKTVRLAGSRRGWQSFYVIEGGQPVSQHDVPSSWIHAGGVHRLQAIRTGGHCYQHVDEQGSLQDFIDDHFVVVHVG